MDLNKPTEKQGNSPKITTVKISSQTKDRLDLLRVYERETYEDILVRVLKVLNFARNTPLKAQHELLLIEKERKRNFKTSIN